MVDFVAKNPHMTPTPGPHDQNAYHYTDIPIQEAHYRNNSVGASNIDIVHMIRNCIAILEGHSTAANNPTNIPPKTALRLLVHYVGDIHQPLQVGAIYFSPNAQPANPNTTANTQFATGGNAIKFNGTAADLHTHWDTPAVAKAMSAANASTPRAFAQKLIANHRKVGRAAPS
ncbi:MAG: S1/P1 nuclease [Verrucomicrobiota bacterium]|nr:S1/P1 nuclease [Verrucomicrobiota bacterium]